VLLSPGTMSRQRFGSWQGKWGFPRTLSCIGTRHTMLTESGTSGADASTIQLIAGHEDIRTSQKYLHPAPEHIIRAFERMYAVREHSRVQ
jgi:site-specific recombinase XerD